MNSKVFIAVFLLVFGLAYTQNYSQDVILNMYGAGIYADTNKTNVKEEKTKNKNVTPNYSTYTSDYLLQALSGYFETSPIYSKSKKIFARGAIAGEVSYLISPDGKIVPAVTKLGDVVARNKKKKGPDYIIDGRVFKYEYSRFRNYNNIWSEYLPRPSIRAIIVDKNILASLNSIENNGFYFYREDTDSVLIRTGDYLFVNLGGSDLYSMQKSLFKKTYKIYKKK